MNTSTGPRLTRKLPEEQRHVIPLTILSMLFRLIQSDMDHAHGLFLLGYVFSLRVVE